MFFLSLVFLLKATLVDNTSLLLAGQIVKIMGLSLVLISFYIDPILNPPAKAVLALPLALAHSFTPLAAVLFLIIAIVILRRTTEGYEKQARPLFWSFLFLSFAEVLEISFSGASITQIVSFSQLLTPFGLTFNVLLAIELVGLIILGAWTWGYLRFRSGPQLFILFVTSSLFIFIITASTFTYLLFRNFQITTLDHLRKDVNTLGYALDEVKAKSLANTKLISIDEQIKTALADEDLETLNRLSSNYMLSQNTSFLNITDKDGRVIVRAEDEESTGDSLRENPAVRKALAGENAATVAVKQEVVAPFVEIQTASPIFDTENTVQGVVVAGERIDNAFVDRVKAITNLDVSIYAGNTRAATTFLAPDGKSRLVGTLETNEEILETVLTQEETFVGSVEVLHQPFYAAYAPLKDVDDNAIGMLFVGNLQTGLIQTLETSIQLTFTISAVLMLASLIPAYFISKYVDEHQSA